jgi:hypothetical protein
MLASHHLIISSVLCPAPDWSLSFM